MYFNKVKMRTNCLTFTFDMTSIIFFIVINNTILFFCFIKIKLYSSHKWDIYVVVQKEDISKGRATKNNRIIIGITIELIYVKKKNGQ